MICPKCGRPVEENAVICRGCDFILDTGFLGDGILDEDYSLRPGAGGVDPAAFNLADAVILGNIDDESQSFETNDSGFHFKVNLSARLYVSGRSQALMSPDAVPALVSSSDGIRLTPFEKHVLAFIDGKKPVEVIRRAAGLDEAEVKTALATLADKGVVKVVGRALADFDPGMETAARRAPPRHRVRGSVVGAVALVGDEADRAIEDAFRTHVAAGPSLSLSKPPDGGAVFSDSDMPSDVDYLLALKGTDEIEKPKRLTASPRVEAAKVRPSAMKGAVNRTSGRVPRPPLPAIDDSQEGIDASAEASAIERSIVDRSDGFDEFGQPSEFSTAVAERQASESSLPSGTAAPRGGRSPFVDRSDSDNAAVPGMENVADSRVAKRPIGSSSRQPEADAASSPARSAKPSPAGPFDSPSAEVELRAATGDVWNENPSAVRPASSRAAQDVSASLSDLLSLEDREQTQNVPPERARALPGVKPPPLPAPSYEEPTATQQPMPPLPLPRLARAADGAPPGPGKLVEPPGAQPSGRAKAARPGAAVPAEPGSAGAPLAKPPPSPPRGAADELFGDDGDSKSSAPSLGRGPALRSEDTTGDLIRGASARASDGEGASVENDDLLESGVNSPGLPAGGHAPSSARVQRQPALHLAAPNAEAHKDHSVSAETGAAASERSVEILDSALLVRPAAAGRQGRADPPSPPRDGASRKNAAASSDDEPPAEFQQEDSDETINLGPEELERRLAERRATGKGAQGVVAAGGGVAAIPPGFSQVGAEAEAAGARPSDENRRKARQLFDEARKEAAAGRLGAARMNAKLASIYDPENDEYRAQLEAWERKGNAPPRPPVPTSPSSSQSASRVSEENQAEIKALYDEAQRLEDRGDIDSALDVLEQGVARFPNAAAFYNRIGVILALRKRDYEHAVQAIQRAIDIDPENLHYKSNLGKIFAKMRRGAS